MIVVALQDQLRSLRRQVEHLPEDVYRAAGGRASGSIGQHVRHVADHVRALLDLPDTSTLSYDARLRGTRVEREPSCAAEELVRLCIAIEALDDLPFDREVTLSMVTDGTHAAAAVRSSIGRELAFVLQHTIHHCAIVAILLEGAGRPVPPRFGYAPSTPVPA
jgi:uncharacterized damage-inducible protein DinB